MSDLRIQLQRLADAVSPETGTDDSILDTAETSIRRLADTLPSKLGGGRKRSLNHHLVG